MPQQIVGAYGTLLNHTVIRELLKASVAYRPKVIVGMVPRIQQVVPVPVDRFEVTVGSVITSDGILIEFEEPEVVTFGTPAVATEKTVVLQHTPGVVLGGNAASIVLVDGRVKEVANSVVLGWINYPGGNIPLVDAHITPAPQVWDTPLEAKYEDHVYPHVAMQAPHNDLFDDPANDAQITRSLNRQDVDGNGFTYWITELANSDPINPQTWTGWIQLRTPSIAGIASPYYHIEMDIEVDGPGLEGQAQIEGQTEALFNVAPAAGTWTRISVDIPANVQPDSGEVLLIRLLANLNAGGGYLRIGNVTITSRSLPFVP